MNDLQAQAQKFFETEHHEAKTIKEKEETITSQYEKYESTTFYLQTGLEHSLVYTDMDTFVVIVGSKAWLASVGPDWKKPMIYNNCSEISTTRNLGSSKEVLVSLKPHFWSSLKNFILHR